MKRPCGARAGPKSAAKVGFFQSAAGRPGRAEVTGRHSGHRQASEKSVRWISGTCMVEAKSAKRWLNFGSAGSPATHRQVDAEARSPGLRHLVGSAATLSDGFLESGTGPAFRPKICPWVVQKIRCVDWGRRAAESSDALSTRERLEECGFGDGAQGRAGGREHCGATTYRHTQNDGTLNIAAHSLVAAPDVLRGAKAKQRR